MSPTRDLGPSPAGPGGPTRRRSLAVPGLVLVAVTVLAGCGEQPSASGRGAEDTSGTAEASLVARLTKGEARPELSCPTDERSGLSADFARDAKGAATPEEALTGEDLEDGETLLLDARGSTAWVLRADGTARAQLGLRELGGWVVSDRIACG